MRSVCILCRVPPFFCSVRGHGGCLVPKKRRDPIREDGVAERQELKEGGAHPSPQVDTTQEQDRAKDEQGE